MLWEILGAPPENAVFLLKDNELTSDNVERGSLPVRVCFAQKAQYWLPILLEQ